MKVIDLLNRIANGEEVPEKIIIDKTVYTYDNKERQYKYVSDEEIASCDDIYGNTLILSYESFSTLDEFLNKEVEIIEEDKKIEKLDKYADVSGDLACEWDFTEKKLKDKINEIIDVINEMKNGQN